MGNILTKLDSPTPRKWKRIGNAILATGMFIVGGGLLAFDSISDIFGDHVLKIVIGVFFILTVAGKFITELFTEEKPQ
jgi:hypothetical protein